MGHAQFSRKFYNTCGPQKKNKWDGRIKSPLMRGAEGIQIRVGDLGATFADFPEFDFRTLPFFDIENKEKGFRRKLLDRLGTYGHKALGDGTEQNPFLLQVLEDPVKGGKWVRPDSWPGDEIDEAVDHLLGQPVVRPACNSLLLA